MKMIERDEERNKEDFKNEKNGRNMRRECRGRSGIRKGKN
jgi:hypothetical protein